jgi:6-phosphogluconolactonase
MKKFLFLLLTLSQPAFAQSDKTYLFVGTYTNAQPAKGIYIYEFDSKTGVLKAVSDGENITNPSFLTLSADGNFIYACTETKMKDAGSVSAFKFNPLKGSFTFLNKQASAGENPVYVTTSKNNEYIINANYTEGTVSIFKIKPDGSLEPHIQQIQFTGSGPNQRRQDKAHIHAAVFSPDYKYIYFPDLGSDKIHAFRFDASKTQPLQAKEEFDVNTVRGSGPRHFTFHPNQKFAYCIEELSGTISAYKYENGKLDSIQRISSYSKIYEEYSSADIHISADGLFLYASNRMNENSISIYSIDILSGQLKLIGHQTTSGDHPRNFTLDPTGNFLLVANQVSNNIVVFKRDVKTGLLTKTINEIEVPSPSCLQMRTY